MTEALKGPVSAHTDWITALEDDFLRNFVQDSWILLPVRNLLVPTAPPQVIKALASFVKGRSREAGRMYVPQIERFLTWRRHEAAAAIGKVPVLLATPTEGSGHVDPGVLVSRLERLEAAGAEPGRADLAQALIRVPRDVELAAVARAKGLTSKAGRTVASWLDGGGLAEPSVECRLLDQFVGTGGQNARLPVRVLSTVDVPSKSDIAHLCRFPEDGWAGVHRIRPVQTAAHWPSVLPSHRDVAAAHLVPYTVGTEDESWDQGPILLDLAEADGPAGAATGTLLASGLANRRENHRADAAEALLVLSARRPPRRRDGDGARPPRRPRPHRPPPRREGPHGRRRRGRRRRRLDGPRRRPPARAPGARRARGGGRPRPAGPRHPDGRVDRGEGRRPGRGRGGGTRRLVPPGQGVRTAAPHPRNVTASAGVSRNDGPA